MDSGQNKSTPGTMVTRPEHVMRSLIHTHKEGEGERERGRQAVCLAVIYLAIDLFCSPN